MDETGVAQPLPFLWALGFVVMTVAAHVAIGYLLKARRASSLRAAALPLAVAAAALGTGVWSAMALALSGEALPFALGYGPLLLAAAWGVAVLAAALGLAPWLRWRHAGAVLAGGLVLGAGTLLAQRLLLQSAGLEPAVPERLDALVLAAPMAASGAVAGLWLALLGAGQRGRHRRNWRWAAAALLAVGVSVGQELVLVSASLAARTASAQAQALPAVATTLVGGIGVPMLLIFLEADLGLRQPVVEGLVTKRRRRRRAKQPIL